MGEMSGLHIVIVPAWWPSPERPGAGVFFEDYARAFAAAGAKVGVVYPDLVGLRQIGQAGAAAIRPLVRFEECSGIPVVRVRGVQTSLGLAGVQMRRFRRRLERGLSEYAARHGTPDVLHAMCAIPAGWACTRMEAPLGRRVIITEHTGPFGLALRPASRGPYVGEALERARAVVGVSEVLRSQMREAGFGREILVCGNPVADEFMRPAIGRRTRNEPIRAIFVGRLVEEKGVRELCTAAAALRDRPGLEWHFAGDGPLAGEIKGCFESAGMRGRLHLHGLCDRPTVAGLMGTSDLLVLPTHGEIFGLAVAEALCMGLPVVTTRGTACAEFVGPDDGELVERQNAAAFADGIRRLISRWDQFDAAGISERARSRFAAAGVAAWYAELFRRVIAE